MKKALLLLLVLSSPVFAQTEHPPVYDSAFPACSAVYEGQIRSWNVGASAADCDVGGGAFTVYCGCSDDSGPFEWAAVGGGSGDITSVGDCATGDCFQTETSRFGLMAPDGGGQAAFRALVEADISDLAHTSTPANVLTVCPSGCDHTTPKSAIDWVVANVVLSTSNRWLVDVYSGEYWDTTAVTVPSFLWVRGSGGLARTAIWTPGVRWGAWSSACDADFITLEDEAVVSNLLIQVTACTQTVADTAAVVLQGSGSALVQASILASHTNGGNRYATVRSDGGGFLWDVHLEANGTGMVGLWQGSTADVRAENVLIEADIGVLVSAANDVLAHNLSISELTTDISLTSTGEVTYFDAATATVPGVVQKSSSSGEILYEDASGILAGSPLTTDGTDVTLMTGDLYIEKPGASGQNIFFRNTGGSPFGRVAADASENLFMGTYTNGDLLELGGDGGIILSVDNTQVAYLKKSGTTAEAVPLTCFDDTASQGCIVQQAAGNVVSPFEVQDSAGVADFEVEADGDVLIGADNDLILQKTGSGTQGIYFGNSPYSTIYGMIQIGAGEDLTIGTLINNDTTKIIGDGAVYLAVGGSTQLTIDGAGDTTIANHLFATLPGGDLFEENGGADTTSNIVVTTAGTYYGWTTAGSQNLEDVTADTADVTADHLTITTAGVYDVGIFTSFAGTSSSVVACYLFDTGVRTTIGFTRKIGTAGDVGDANTGGSYDAAASDELSIRCTSDGNGDTLDIYNFRLTITRRGA